MAFGGMLFVIVTKKVQQLMVLGEMSNEDLLEEVVTNADDF